MKSIPEEREANRRGGAKWGHGCEGKLRLCQGEVSEVPTSRHPRARLTRHAGDPNTRKAEAQALRAQAQAGSIKDAGRT